MIKKTVKSKRRDEDCYQRQDSSKCCKCSPCKSKEFGGCRAETFFQDDEAGVRLDGAEDAPCDGHSEDCGRVPTLSLIKDGLESSRGWCVCPVEEKK